MSLDYTRTKDWILREDSFDPQHLGKCEAIMCLGNGYLGLRSATEEKYLNETRDLLINGTFNQFDPSSVTELPNAADMTAIEITVNGERFTLEQGSIDFYSRELNIKTAELKREVVWISPKGEQFSLTFRRVVSLGRLHDFAIQAQITPLSGDAEIEIKSGINGRVTNTGAQHFTEGDMRFYEGRHIQYVPRTTQSGIAFALNTAHSFWKDGKELELPVQLYMEIRSICGGYRTKVKKGETLKIEKYCNVYTARDLEMQGKTVEELQAFSLEKLKELQGIGYQSLAEDTEKEWNRQVWEKAPIAIEGNDYDNFAVHFAQYHMRLMVPAHDNRMNIGAKGLSGEGYRGHCFWDTGILLLPYYAFTQPETARKLEEITYDEMLELASQGAQVLHNRSVELAKKFRVNLEVLSSLERKPGTKVKEVAKVEKTNIAGVAKDTSIARIALIGLEHNPGVAFQVFDLLSKHNINVDVILQSIGREETKDITFTLHRKDLTEAEDILNEHKAALRFDHSETDAGIGKVSIVGVGLISNCGVAAKMFEALYEAGINIQMINTSEIRVSVLLDEEDVNRAVKAIHAKFFDEI